MTLSLYLLRHAKAEESAPAGGDYERPLKRRGKKAARAVGKYLTRLGEEPELVLTSPAARARETADLAREEGGWEARSELCPAIYEASADTLLRQISAVEANVGRLLLVGHQPSLSLLIAELTGSEPDFPTGALARVDFELARWREVEQGKGRLVWLVTPDVVAALRPRSRT